MYNIHLYFIYIFIYPYPLSPQIYPLKLKLWNSDNSPEIYDPLFINDLFVPKNIHK